MTPPIVLLVDDDSDFRSVLGEILRDEGCHVEEAADGEEALHMLESIVPDLLMVDLMMPVLNGWSLFAAIEGRPELRDVTVVFLTGVPQMAPAGGSLVLKKPLDLPALMALLDTVRAESPRSEMRLKAAPRSYPAYRAYHAKRSS
jgi:CheY-like chemotaxis protein